MFVNTEIILLSSNHDGGDVHNNNDIYNVLFVLNQDNRRGYTSVWFMG